MNLKQIVTNSTGLDVTKEEALYVIQEYIRIRRNRNINPIIDQSGAVSIFDELTLMHKMAAHAIGWLQLNPHKL